MRHSLLNPPPEALDALARLVEMLQAVRAQRHTLEAAEALLLQSGSMVAEAIVTASDGAANREMAYRMVESEIGAALHESDRTVSTKMGRATQLVEHYPDVYQALLSGKVSAAHAHTIVDAGEIITEPAQREAYAERALEYAEGETVGRLRPVVQRLAEHYADRSLEERHVEAVKTRCVRVVDGPDGMSDLIAHLPTVYAHGVKDRLDRIAYAVTREREHAREHATAVAEVEATAVESGDSADVSGVEIVGASQEARSAGRDVFGQNTGEARASTGTEAEGPGANRKATSSTAVYVSPPARDTRTMDQIRTDTFTDLLLTGMGAAQDLGTDVADSIGSADGVGNARSTGSAGNALDTSSGMPDFAGITAHVQIVVPVTRLRPTAPPGAAPPGCDRPDPAAEKLLGDLAEGTSVPGHDGPAHLEGVGPIDTESARTLAGQATSWDRVNIDAETGVILSVETYQPSAAMRRYLRVRDLHCRFPGCRIPIRRCDIDHTIDAAHGGKTSTDNLGALCRRHHTLKHATPWQVSQDQAGVYTWVSPTGLTHIDKPASRVRFTPVTPPGPAQPPKPQDSEPF